MDDSASNHPTLGVAVIGAGSIFRDHADAWAALSPSVRVIGVADLDPERLWRASSDRFIPLATARWRELVERPDVDIVDVCTPPAAHEEAVVAGLRADKYVVCEKPLAPSLAAADRILAVAAGHPGRLSVVYQLRFGAFARRVRWLRDRGHLGELRLGHFHRAATPPRPTSESGSWWGRWDVAGGGVVMTQFIHELDLATHLFGRVRRVHASMRTSAEALESEDTFAATLETASGALISCSASVVAHGFDQRIDVYGDDASVHLPWRVRAGRGAAELMREAEHTFPDPTVLRRRSLPRRALGRALRELGLRGPWSPAENGHAAYLRAVVDSVRAGKPLPSGPAEARVSLELCTAIYRSALTGEAVDLPLPASAEEYAGISEESYRRVRHSGRADQQMIG